MADPTYRQATESDAVGIAAVGTAVWEELGAGSGLPGAPTAAGVVARMKELGDRGVTFVCTDGETVSYGQLAERVNRCGNALRAADLAPGDRLLMIVRDCPAFFYLFWGAIKAGSTSAEKSGE